MVFLVVFEVFRETADVWGWYNTGFWYFVWFGRLYCFCGFLWLLLGLWIFSVFWEFAGYFGGFRVILGNLRGFDVFAYFVRFWKLAMLWVILVYLVILEFWRWLGWYDTEFWCFCYGGNLVCVGCWDFGVCDFMFGVSFAFVVV